MHFREREALEHCPDLGNIASRQLTLWISEQLKVFKWDYICHARFTLITAIACQRDCMPCMQLCPFQDINFCLLNELEFHAGLH